MIQNFALIAFTNIRHRKLRSFLTIIAIVIGIGAVISLISVSQGMQQAISGQFEKLGTDLIIVMPGGGGGLESFAGFSGEKLTDHDVDVISRARGVEHASGMVYSIVKVSSGDETKYTFVIGMPTDKESAFIFAKFDVEGRRPESGDKYKAAIGYLIAHGQFFERAVRLGNRILINDVSFDVVGIVEEIGTRSDDTQIYIPLETAQELLNVSDEFDMIYVKVREGFSASAVADNIRKEMRDDRDQEVGEENFSVQSSEQLMQIMNNILGVIQVILIGIAGISLLVGGIGIMNTMYTAVLERTREIGILKAIGARNSNVLTIFMLESGIIGLVGGALGTMLGLGLAKAVEVVGSEMGFGLLKVSASIELIIMGLGFAFIIGCVSGVMPARRAAKMQPADALRYE